MSYRDSRAKAGRRQAAAGQAGRRADGKASTRAGRRHAGGRQAGKHGGKQAGKRGGQDKGQRAEGRKTLLPQLAALAPQLGSMQDSLRSTNDAANQRFSSLLEAAHRQSRDFPDYKSTVESKMDEMCENLASLQADNLALSAQIQSLKQQGLL